MSRLDRYDPATLDMLCLAGEVSWARLSAPRVLKMSSATPVALFLRMPLITPPGAKYRYSNPGYSLLAAVVEKALVICLPGKPSGAVECLGFVTGAIPHCVEVLQEVPTSC